MRSVITESLRNLDRDAAAVLFASLTGPDQYAFEERPEPDGTAMFIFPDGRILGATDSAMQDNYGLGRDVWHQEIYDRGIFKSGLDITKRKRSGHYDQHPTGDKELAETYNLIIVAAYHTDKYVMVPKRVEPTEAQIETLKRFHQAGFKIEGYPRIYDILLAEASHEK
jgi:hypothetical protein